MSTTPAFTVDEYRAVEQRLRTLETKPPFDMERAADAVGRIRRPDVVRERLGDPIRYSQRVEAEVAGLGIDSLLPHERDSHIGRFLEIWVPDEQRHGTSQEELLRALELPVYEARPADHVPLHNRIAGTLGKISSHAHSIVSMTYHSIGAMNERLALGAYRQMAAVAEELGERELADNLFGPTARDEAVHLGYYRTYATQLRNRIAPWQLAVVRALVVRTYFPVGAGEKRDRPPFGRVLIALEEDPENPTIADAVHDIATGLLAKRDRELPPFVHRALQSCVELARAA